MIFKNDPYKFGYYEVNGLRTFSKLEAIEIQNATGHWPHWRFNDEVFGKVNWQKEPQINLEQLYRARARQIREAYDYVILFYSGGSDSINILDMWLKEDLKIDEIASFWNYDATKDVNSYCNIEIDKVVFPRIAQLKDDGIEFKFRLIDISQQTASFLNEMDNDYIYIVNHHFSPNSVMKNQFRNRISDYAKLIDSGKSVCIVWGMDKPQLFLENETGRHYCQFIDMMDSCVGPYVQQRMNQGWYDELFYWTPDMPELIIKQAQTVLKFVKNCHLDNLYQTKPNKYGYNKTLKKYLTDAAIKTIIYPTWNPNTFDAGKSRSVTYSDRDTWIWDGNIRQTEILKSLSKQYFSKIGSYWMNDPTNSAKGVKGHCSPRYYLD